MKKYKSGVTVVSVLIIVVVLAILSSAIVISSKLITDYTYKKEFKNEYYLVKSAVNDYITRNSGVIDFEETQIDLTNITNNNLSQFSGETIVSNKIDAYVVDLDKVGVYNTTYGNKLDNNVNDVYVVTKDKHTVYYKNGFSSNDSVYYKAIED